MMNDFELRIDGGWRGTSNWAGPKDRKFSGVTFLMPILTLMFTARSNALSLE